MGNIRKLKVGLAGAALCAATPALASDFSGIYYAFLILGAVVAGIVAMVVFTIRRFSTTRGPVFDAACAIALGLAFAPSGFVYGSGGAFFSPIPAWLWILLAVQDVAGATSLIGPIVSITVLSLVFYLWFRHLRMTHAKPEAE